MATNGMAVSTTATIGAVEVRPNHSDARKAHTTAGSASSTSVVSLSSPRAQAGGADQQAQHRPCGDPDGQPDGVALQAEASGAQNSPTSMPPWEPPGPRSP